jgi:hypothetical protein
MTRAWERSRFDAEAEEPLGPLANLVDIMLVFACGLIAALVANNNFEHPFQDQGQSIERKRELPHLPEGAGEGGSGYESVGQVYKDPKTGKLFLIQ